MYLRYFLWLVFGVFLGPAISSYGDNGKDSLLIQLNQAIKDRPHIVEGKQKRIEGYTSTVPLDEQGKFDNYLHIYNEYKSFIYDSAFKYAVKLQKSAYALNDPARITSAKIKLGFVQVSAGLFKEALDTLNTIQPAMLVNPLRSEYYYLMARAHYDLSDFNRDDFYSSQYTMLGNAYMDSAMNSLDQNSTQFILYKGLKDLRVGDADSARVNFEKIIKAHLLNDHELAVAASTLSFIYKYENKTEQAKAMLVRAAIADIRSSTKETLAMLNLADMLYKEGDIENAYSYVKIAMEDANFYGARHRKVQVAAVFPIIEGKQLSMVDAKRRMLFLYASVITVLTIILIGLAIVIYKQFLRLRTAKKIITEANDNLTETNYRLVDANKIKEEYVWYYFRTTADYISKIDNLKKAMEMKLLTKKLEDLKFIVDNINIKKERDDLYHNFDLVFLKLFPNFVTAFNSFLNPEDQIILKDGQLLNTELRIFALIRMGIDDNEKIAKILDYSVATIYTYKTRIRGKSVLPNEQFDRRIRGI